MTTSDDIGRFGRFASLLLIAVLTTGGCLRQGFTPGATEDGGAPERGPTPDKRAPADEGAVDAGQPGDTAPDGADGSRDGLEVAPPTRAPGLADTIVMRDPALTRDALTLYYTAVDDATKRHDIWRASRSTRSSAFESPFKLAINGAFHDRSPSISADELSLYFDSTRPGGQGNRDIYVATRASVDEPFANPVALQQLNSAKQDSDPSISPDGLELFWQSTRADSSEIWGASRPSTSEPFGNVRSLELDPGNGHGDPSFSGDGLRLFLHSDRPGGTGLSDLYFITRASVGVDFVGGITPVPTVNSPFVELDPFLTADNCELFFVSGRSGAPAIWVARQECGG